MTQISKDITIGELLQVNMAVLVLIPTMFAFDAVRKKQGQPYGWPKEKSERKTLLAAGLVCVFWPRS